MTLTVVSDLIFAESWQEKAIDMGLLWILAFSSTDANPSPTGARTLRPFVLPCRPASIYWSKIVWYVHTRSSDAILNGSKEKIVAHWLLKEIIHS